MDCNWCDGEDVWENETRKMDKAVEDSVDSALDTAGINGAVESGKTTEYECGECGAKFIVSKVTVSDQRFITKGNSTMKSE